MASGRSDGPADVLAQATRARLFDRLADLGRPAGTDELAADLGLHASGVRVHLERMRAAGLIAREREPQAIGRPRASWSIASEAQPGGEPPGAYRLLARWLARCIPATAARLREVERTGRELGREVCPVPTHGSAPTVDSIGRALTALGFAPQRRPADAGRAAFLLGNCPYREAVHDNQPVVCALHRGLTRGLLDQLHPAARLARFEPEDPDRAGCLIEIEGLPAR